MAKTPQSKAITQDPYIFRQPFQWTTYRGPGTAETWRTLAANQPVAELCKQKLSLHAQATEWGVEARHAEDADKYKEDIEYYTEVLDHPAMPFDEWIDLMLNDMLDLPQGATSELVRWKPGKGPLKHENKNGHVHEIHFIDGATIRPTGDREIPVVQQVGNQVVWFKQLEVARMLFGRRPELQLQGYSRPPLEKAYLAIQMLYYGDVYYAKYLIDTPEAGILYLGDMDQESAMEWLDGFRALFGGASPFKIPVIAGTDKPPTWTPFSLDPSKIAYDTTIDRYSKIVAATYGLKMSDLGLDSGADSLAGKIRDERAFMGTGMGAILIKIENMINSRILPPYLVFRFKAHDEETTIQKMRARLMAGQAAKALEEAQIATAAEIQQQYKLEGLFTVPLKKPPAGPPPEAAPAAKGPAERDVPTEARQNPTNGQVRNEMRKVPVTEGGEGDVRSEAPRKLREEKALVERAQARWPAGTAGSRGGQFAPGDSSALMSLIGSVQADDEYNNILQVILSLSEKTGVPEEQIDQIISAWADNMSDETTNLQVQAVASQMFGAPLSDHQRSMARDIDHEIKMGRQAPPNLDRNTVQTVLQGIYDNTQQTLAQAGIDEVTVYRGLTLREPPGAEGETVQVTDNTLSSWTANRQIAEEFRGEGIGSYGATLAKTVPASRVMSLASTGLGTAPEYEVVIIGPPNGISEATVASLASLEGAQAEEVLGF